MYSALRSRPVVIAAAFLLLRLSENSKIKGDAAIALISTGSLALGVIIISLTTGMNTDVYNVLGMRMMGAMLISSLIIFPSLSALLDNRRLNAA